MKKSKLATRQRQMKANYFKAQIIRGKGREYIDGEGRVYKVGRGSWTTIRLA